MKMNKIAMFSMIAASMSSAPSYMKDVGNIYSHPAPTPNTKRGKFKPSMRNKKGKK